LRVLLCRGRPRSTGFENHRPVELFRAYTVHTWKCAQTRALGAFTLGEDSRQETISKLQVAHEMSAPGWRRKRLDAEVQHGAFPERHGGASNEGARSNFESNSEVDYMVDRVSNQPTQFVRPKLTRSGKKPEPQSFADVTHDPTRRV